MPFARIDGTLLHYRLAGPANGPPLAFINSLGTDARIWDETIRPLAGTYRILSYDKRGHGLSDVPGGDYSIDDHLADLNGLLDHAGITKPIGLIGVSVGGLIAQAFAVNHATRLKALVLCCTAPHIGTRDLWNDRIAAVRAHGVGALADGVMERWFGPTFRSTRADELAGWRNLFLRCPASGYASTCATLRDSDLTAAISGIATPTLVVAGSEDQATPVALVQDCASRIAGARLEVLDGVGHIPSIDQPGLLADLIDSFMKDAGHD